MSTCQVRLRVPLIHFHSQTQTRVPSITGDYAYDRRQILGLLNPAPFQPDFWFPFVMLAAARQCSRHLSEWDGGRE